VGIPVQQLFRLVIGNQSALASLHNFPKAENFLLWVFVDTSVVVCGESGIDFYKTKRGIPERMLKLKDDQTTGCSPRYG